MKTEDIKVIPGPQNNTTIGSLKSRLEKVESTQKNVGKLNQLSMKIKAKIGEALHRNFVRKKESYLFHPSVEWKLNWDVLMTVLLIYSCVATPV